MLKKLNTLSLNEISGKVSVPGYDRKALSAGIVHVGLGNFHRSHQAVYLNRLFHQGEGYDWGVLGAGIMTQDALMRDKLLEQDCLYSVIELDPQGYTGEVCGSVVDFAEVSNHGVFKAMCLPEIRIVSLTITEGGYYIDPNTEGFDCKNRVIQAETDINEPQTVFGIIVKALKYRKENGMPPFTILSCDNIPKNGHAARNAVVGVAEIMAPDMAKWIADNVAFPSSMVDRITPATGKRELDLVREQFGYQDDCVVVCETFSQWVIEDDFPQGRPALEKVGVEFVNDVTMHELMKIRILNAGHAAIAYPSRLLGIDYAHDAMASRVIVDYLDKLEREETIPTLVTSAEVDYVQYFEKVKERFANPEIADTIDRLCMDGSNRQPKFILPIIHNRLQNGKAVRGLALEVALWCRYCAGVNERGDPVTINDPKADLLKENARKAKTNPAAFLGMSDVFGTLSDNGIFLSEFSNSLNGLWRKGTQEMLRDYVARQD
ncbi:MAG: mannitol dehydrogenase family protein [Hyphomicrobiales bacterium]|nr:mannitol dehydrogenase family protein [Hyphomicrobiales bacterium]